MLGEPWLPTSTLISGTLISKDFATFFPPSSSSYLRAMIPVVTNSPNSILHMIVGYRSQAIAWWWNAWNKCSCSRGKHQLTSFWMHLTSVQSHLVYYHPKKKSSSWWRIILGFIFPTSASVLQVSRAEHSNSPQTLNGTTGVLLWWKWTNRGYCKPCLFLYSHRSKNGEMAGQG